MILPFSQVYVLALVLGHPDSIERSEEERRQFWLQASLREQRVEVDTLTLPPLSFSYGGPRVAICVTGQVRTMPFILKTLKLNIVDALGANTTDIFYVVDLEESHARVPAHRLDGRLETAQGSFSYTLSQFTHMIRKHGLEATALLAFHEAASYEKDWICVLEYEKLQTCADLVERRERDVGLRYDFVVRQRTDMLITSPAQPATTLKRAVYMARAPHGMDDMLGLTHRDFLDGMFGMLRFRNMWPVPNPRPCKRCSSCEGWMEHSLLLYNATFASDGFLEGRVLRCTNDRNRSISHEHGVACNSTVLDFT